jgi:hypothetical protein
MVKLLRKRHLQVWMLWSVLLPLGLISALLVRPVFPKDKLLQPTTVESLPVVLKSFNKENYAINLRCNNDTSQLQLEWINKRTLTYPTTTIYQDITNTNDISKAVLIGRIEARGTYHFNLKKNSNSNCHFIVYDFIHKQIIDSITF